MFGLFGGGNRPSLLKDTVKAGAAIAGLSLLATQWLSQGFDKPALQRLAAEAAIGDGPATTGSITRDARAVLLDPCTGKPR